MGAGSRARLGCPRTEEVAGWQGLASTEGVWESGWSPKSPPAAVGAVGEAEGWLALQRDIWGRTNASEMSQVVLRILTFCG